MTPEHLIMVAYLLAAAAVLAWAASAPVRWIVALFALAALTAILADWKEQRR